MEYMRSANWIAQHQGSVDEAGQGSRKLKNCTVKSLAVGKHRDAESLIHPFPRSGRLSRPNSNQSDRPEVWNLLEGKTVCQVCWCLYQFSDYLLIFMIVLSKSLGT